MKTIYRKAVSLCLLFVAMFMIVGIAAADSPGSGPTATPSDYSTQVVYDVLEIRGPVYDGSDLSSIIANTAYGDGSVTMDATQFAAFFYDVNNDVTSDTLQIKKT